MGIKLKTLLIEKTLYHGTIIDNVRSIERYGLIPSVGKFVQDAYDMSGYGEDINEDDYLKELVFATDKTQLDKAVTAITAQVAQKLGKNFHDVTDSEFLRNGALVVIKDGEQVMSHKDDDNDREEHPYTVEPGDYYSEENIGVDFVLTGNKMVNVLKRYDLWPRHSTYGDIDANRMKDFIVKLAIKKNPDKSREQNLQIIDTWDEKKLKDTYQKVRRL